MCTCDPAYAVAASVCHCASCEFWCHADKDTILPCQPVDLIDLANAPLDLTATHAMHQGPGLDPVVRNPNAGRVYILHFPHFFFFFFFFIVVVASLQRFETQRYVYLVTVLSTPE